MGFDGAPYGLINRLLEQGKMPNLKALGSNGVQGPLKSVLPPQSLPAWPSFVSGMNPGRHGVYSFFKPETGGYNIRPFSSEDIRGLAIWDYLTSLRIRCFLVNVPLTYPPYPIDGVMISGIPAPLLTEEVQCFPQSFARELQAVAPNYRVEITGGVGYDEDRILSTLHKILDERTKVVLHLLKDKTWQFFMVVFTCSDRVEHVFWRHLDSGHPAGTALGRRKYGQAIDEFFQKLDGALGKVIEVVGGDSTTIVVSDHGHGPQIAEVGVNQLLAEVGALKYAKSYKMGLTQSNLYDKLSKFHLLKLANTLVPKKLRSAISMGIDYEHSSAYCHSFGAINVNVKGREPQGTVAKEDYPRVVEELTKSILEYADVSDGKPIAEKIYRREEIYWGDALESAPDMLVIFRDGYGPRSWNPNGKVIMRYHPKEIDVSKPLIESGGHHWFSTLDGIFFAMGDSIKGGAKIEGASIIDVMPTILHLMSLPIPRNVDGKVLQVFGSDSEPARRAVQYSGTSLSKGPTRIPWSEEEEKAVTKRLADLGYIG
jgi:predicted AlkP superfamily phosphohydrolase/phosphomutase